LSAAADVFPLLHLGELAELGLEPVVVTRPHRFSAAKPETKRSIFGGSPRASRRSDRAWEGGELGEVLVDEAIDEGVAFEWVRAELRSKSRWPASL